MKPPPLPSRSDSWWDRNWKWAAAVLFVGSGGLIVAFFFGLLGFLRSTDAYQGALTRVKTAPPVLAVLGSPIEDKLLFTGTVNQMNDRGVATLAIPIRGTKGEAVAHVHANRDSAGWHYHRLLVRVSATGTEIDLSEKSPPVERP